MDNPAPAALVDVAREPSMYIDYTAIAAGGISIPVVMQQMDQFDGGAML